MINTITGKWPLYKYNDEILLDKHARYSILKVVGDGNSDYMMNDFSYYSPWIDGYNFVAKETVMPRVGPGCILAAVMLANMGIVTVPHGEGSYVVQILAMERKTEALKTYVRYNLYMDNPLAKVNPGVVVGLFQAYNQHISSEMDSVLKELIKEAVKKGSAYIKLPLAINEKDVMAASAIASWLSSDKESVIGDEQMKTSTNFRKRFMWMCRDPYLRMAEFDRPDLVKTVRSIKCVFPFALPDRMDLDTRDTDDILRGIYRTVSFSHPAVIGSDQRIVSSAIRAYTKVIDSSQATKLEWDLHINEYMLKYVMYHENPMWLLDRILSRMKEDVWVSVNIILPEFALINQGGLEDVILRMERDRRINRISVEPVQLVSST